MAIITTRDRTEIYYKDWGSGQPIVFHHGWPLSSDFGISNGIWSALKEGDGVEVAWEQEIVWREQV